MDARQYLDEEYPVGGTAIAYIVVWELPRSLPGSSHRYKYRLALVDDAVNVLRYDNKAGKGDHRHVGNRQFPYRFVDVDELLLDFWKDVEQWQRTKSGW